MADADLATPPSPPAYDTSTDSELSHVSVDNKIEETASHISACWHRSVRAEWQDVDGQIQSLPDLALSICYNPIANTAFFKLQTRVDLEGCKHYHFYLHVAPERVQKPGTRQPNLDTRQCRLSSLHRSGHVIPKNPQSERSLQLLQLLGQAAVFTLVASIPLRTISDVNFRSLSDALARKNLTTDPDQANVRRYYRGQGGTAVDLAGPAADCEGKESNHSIVQNMRTSYHASSPDPLLCSPPNKKRRRESSVTEHNNPPTQSAKSLRGDLKQLAPEPSQLALFRSMFEHFEKAMKELREENRELKQAVGEVADLRATITALNTKVESLERRLDAEGEELERRVDVVEDGLTSLDAWTEDHDHEYDAGQVKDIVREVFEEDFDNPSWWCTMQYNTGACLLCRLPEELLLMICRNLEGADVYITRQTCSLFRRILSGGEFGSPFPPQLSRRPGPYTFVPRLGVDWEHVSERLRRRRCCSACKEARMPKQDGGASVWDSLMFRMANETKYCTACRAWHPLIMFSQSQRNLTSGPPTDHSSHEGSAQPDREGGAVCIMAEGGVAVCPHQTVSVSLEKIREWHEAVVQDRSLELSWPLRCELCFPELGKPFRSAAVQPSATYIPSRDAKPNGSVMGKAYVQWTLPLQVDAATILGGDWISVRDGTVDTNSRPAHVQKLETALSKAAETYNELLCPHARFDDPYTLRDFAWHSNQTVTDFRNGRGWTCELKRDGYEQKHPSGSRAPAGDLCRICSSPRWLRTAALVRRGKWEYLWALDGE
ncbi:hypothetical protein PG997_000138 [Apiospora hydei]|uniref:F-box domain-containing protein n=1 Tax=Apiospora hydei TaxID=1337664 RepID=A0ABR1XA27_9PEZI